MKNLQIIRPKELASLLKVARQTVRNMEKRGELPKRKKFGNRCVGWMQSDIEEWMESRPNAADAGVHR